MDAVVDVAAWWWLVVRTSARDGWEWLPGPWPVKIALIAVLVAGQLVPGELDEALLLVVIAWFRRRHTRRV